MAISKQEELKSFLDKYRFELSGIESALFEGESQFDISKQSYEFPVKEPIVVQDGETISYLDVKKLPKQDQERLGDTYRRKTPEKSQALKNILNELSKVKNIDHINADAFVDVL